MTLKDMLKEMTPYGQKDERIVSEVNKTYAIGFKILTAGILTDLFYSLSRMQVMSVNGLVENPHLFDYFSPIEFITFMVAMIFCIIMQTRRGYVDEGRFAETDTFPTAYFALWSAAGFLVAFILAAGMRCLAEGQILGIDAIHWAANVAIGLVLGVFTFILCFIVFYINFRAAKRAREKQMSELE